MRLIGQMKLEGIVRILIQTDSKKKRKVYGAARKLLLTGDLMILRTSSI